MSKPNTMVQLLQAKKALAQLLVDYERMKGFTLQQALDIAMITLNQEFHFGPERCAKFEEAYRATFMAYAEMSLEDGKDDPEIVYTQEKLDRALRRACGENIMPFQERYSDENLYFRDKAFGEKVNE